MVASTAASASLKEYLKRYESNNEEENKKKKKKKRSKPDAKGVLVVDEDPVWQKPVKLGEESGDDSPDEEKPQIDEDIEVKRMKRLEQLRSRRPYHAISEDGSGWVSVDAPKLLNSDDPSSDMSPPRQHRARKDTPSPEPELKPSGLQRDSFDLSPPRERRRYHHTPSPEAELKPSGLREATDLSPLQQRRRRYHTPSPEPKTKPSELSREDADLSPPRQHQRRHHTPSPEPKLRGLEPSREDTDLSPPRQRRRRQCTPSLEPKLKALEPSGEDSDLSPPRQRRRHHHTPSPEPKLKALEPSREDTDLSPPRQQRRRHHTPSPEHDISPPGRAHRSSPYQDYSNASPTADLSPPRKSRKDLSFLKERTKTGLLSGRDIKEVNAKTKKDDWLRFKDMDPSISGRGAEPVYRDKITGERLSKEELLKLQKKEEKPKEKKLEWGKGLAQKREAEVRQLELEVEKNKPFARSRDDPDLDKMLKERVRWGDPMAHLVKKKHSESFLPDLGDSEKMKESGFIIPQDIPSHSWIKRGLDAAPNRYGIKPGRHWDGVDRSNGYEKELFKRMNEKQATEREAYLWSVSDM
ncbi:uncharacterized protein LOC131157697 [Malania oleifera]|uniref:uncharacterized protein LOC131157697 n=1 Tax=Malania oleifera TaxID=397392 RepID=UPI0025AE9116|nr:uncharacterized protein LOC131157697 [Malania oleifera]